MNVDELNKVKGKIKALTMKTVDNGCTENEAMAAMAMVGRLLTQYNLNMSEIDVREQVCKILHIPTGRKNRHPISTCITALAGLFDAKCWIATKYVDYVKTPSYAFFGHENDLDMISYLYKVIFQAIEHESYMFKNSSEYKFSTGSRKTAYISFQHGMASRIYNRLKEMKKAQIAEMEEAEKANSEYTGSRALVVLKGQLIEDEFKKENIRLKANYNKARVSNTSAYFAGQRAGDKVNLSRPLTGGNNTAGYLT